MYPESIKNLIEAFKYLPGIGEKTAERLAFSILELDDDQVEFFSDSLKDFKTSIKKCSICNSLTDSDICSICSDVSRNNKILCVGEISNMGCTPDAIDLFLKNKILYAPGKAVNAGGVATSGLEMSQNAMHLSWSASDVDKRLHEIMHGIHKQCCKYGTEPDGYINYVKGANIAGFMKVARAMMAQGIV